MILRFAFVLGAFCVFARCVYVRLRTFTFAFVVYVHILFCRLPFAVVARLIAFAAFSRWLRCTFTHVVTRLLLAFTPFVVYVCSCILRCVYWFTFILLVALLRCYILVVHVAVTVCDVYVYVPFVRVDSFVLRLRCLPVVDSLMRLRYCVCVALLPRYTHIVTFTCGLLLTFVTRSARFAFDYYVCVPVTLRLFCVLRSFAVCSRVCVDFTVVTLLPAILYRLIHRSRTRYVVRITRSRYVCLPFVRLRFVRCTLRIIHLRLHSFAFVARCCVYVYHYAVGCVVAFTFRLRLFTHVYVAFTLLRLHVYRFTLVTVWLRYHGLFTLRWVWFVWLRLPLRLRLLPVCYHVTILVCRVDLLPFGLLFVYCWIVAFPCRARTARSTLRLLRYCTLRFAARIRIAVVLIDPVSHSLRSARFTFTDSVDSTRFQFFIDFTRY